MKKRKMWEALRRLTFGAGLTAVLALGLATDSVSTAQSSDVLKVGINPVEPFVFLDGPVPSGFSIDLWDAIANEAGIEYEFIELENVTALLDAVQAEEIDLGIGATSIRASREEVVDFSLPFFAAGLQIMTASDVDQGALSVFRSIFTPNLVRFLAATLATLLVVAHVAWLLERDENEDFQGSYLRGIWGGIYWTIVTASTVGYGDTVLKDSRGKLLAVVWMLLSLFLVSYFTATVTTSLTVGRLESGIRGPQDLRGFSVITLPGTTSAAYLTERGIAHSTVEDVQTAIGALQNGSADALVYDAPVLQYFSNLAIAQDVILVPTIFQNENYGIVLPQGSPLKEEVNQSLLRVQENGVYAQLTQRWFGR
ncbi:MAG: transporter substrate-binding domain-containing protein [Chloroflexota bacterium]